MATFIVGTYSANAQTSRYDGLYMGIEGSYAKTKQTDLTVIAPEFEGVVLESDILSAITRNPLYTAEGGAAGVFVGYRISQGQFTLATEASYSYSFISNEPNASTKFEQTNDNVDVYQLLSGNLEQTGVANYKYDHAIKRDKLSISMIYNF